MLDDIDFSQLESVMELFAATIKHGDDVPNQLAKDFLEAWLVLSIKIVEERDALLQKLERFEYFEQAPALGTA